MGQGQSQTGGKATSNYVSKEASTSSKPKKSKRKTGSKSSFVSSRSDTSATSYSNSSEVSGRNLTHTSTSHTHTAPRQNGSVSSSVSQKVPHRGSFSNGGERSVPSRQFSLTRQPSSQSTQSKHAQIEKYFNKYKDPEEDSILAEGMEKFCIDLGVDPTEFIVLVLAWKFEASQMCRFTKEEFMNGCQKMQAHNAKSLKERFPELLVKARDKTNFKELYNFTFSFGLDHSTGQRSLPITMAVPLWDLVFTQNRPVILEQWFNFLKSSGVKGISRDTWNMFLPFIETILPDLSNYDESEAWPSLFDDFVESEQEKTTL